MLDTTYRPTHIDLRHDLLLMLAFLAGGVFEYFAFGRLYADQSLIATTRDPEPLLLLLTVLTILPLVARRRFPTTAAVVAHLFYAITLGESFAVATSAQLAIITHFYGLAIYVPPAKSNVARGVLMAGMIGWTGLGAAFSGVPGGYVAIAAGIYLGVWILGNNARAKLQNQMLLEERAARAERDRERQTQEAVTRERARIARELHDVVAHSVTVMTVQASGAKRVLEDEPEQARNALEAIESTGRQALAEMRRMVGVMRKDDDGMGRAPQPGLEGLSDLVEQVEASGLDVEWSLDGEAVPLAPGVELTVFRIVQEALTNTLKHGGPNARATVAVRFDNGDLRVDVTDDGRGSLRTSTAGGEGLVGMRERVALYGGELRAGNQPGGGFAVSARIPVAASP